MAVISAYSHLRPIRFAPMDIIARAFLWFSLVVLLLAVPRWTRTHANLDELERLRADVASLQEQRNSLEMENSRLVDRIVALGKSPDARASRAISAYNLLTPREILIRFDEED